MTGISNSLWIFISGFHATWAASFIMSVMSLTHVNVFNTSRVAHVRLAHRPSQLPVRKDNSQHSARVKKPLVTPGRLLERCNHSSGICF